MRAVTISVLALGVVGVAAVGGSAAWLHFAAHTGVDPTKAELVEVTIPKGAGLQQVGKHLADQGLIRSYWAYRIYVRLHAGHAPKAGRHRVSLKMNVPEILEVLDGPPIPDEVPLTIVEGWRLMDIDRALAGQGLIQPGQYLSVARQLDSFKLAFPAPPSGLEGYVYPETYAISKEGPLDIRALIQRQLDAFAQRFALPFAEEIQRSGRSLHELVVMASLLEREEPKPEVRSKVAGVLYRRLDLRSPLGVDATSRYSLEDWSDRQAFLKKLRDPDDPYNTRLRVGLPPGPIGAPSMPSLLAALRPEPSPYLYYLHDADHNIHFAVDAAGHEANRKKYNVY